MNSPVVRDRSDVTPWAAAQRNKGQTRLHGPGRRGRRDRGPPLCRGGVSLRLLDVTDCKARRDQWALPHAVVIATGQPSTATARCRALPSVTARTVPAGHAFSVLTEESGTGRGSRSFPTAE